MSKWRSDTAGQINWFGLLNWSLVPGEKKKQFLVYQSFTFNHSFKTVKIGQRQQMFVDIYNVFLHV